jgi:hypothetical protein
MKGNQIKEAATQALIAKVMEEHAQMMQMSI